MFPETTGRTLEEIEDVFARGYTFTAWRVDRNVGKKTLEQLVELREIFVIGKGVKVTKKVAYS